MTFFLDQDVPDDLAQWLRHRGHVVTCLREVLPTTATDSEAWQWALGHGAVFVSCNRNDVLALHPAGEHPGIVILVRRRTRQTEIAAMQKLPWAEFATGSSTTCATLDFELKISLRRRPTWLRFARSSVKTRLTTRRSSSPASSPLEVAAHCETSSQTDQHA